ncbi:hypothetical protein FKP32DRAFT_1680162 [Trametes sanguinea]|nr:hypothetical protein FKP32DRAFT_1680162 [Trametes sanguinea]
MSALSSPLTFHDFADPLLSVVQEDSISIMLQEFIDAEQAAITYNGLIRDFLPNEAERTPQEEIDRRRREQEEDTPWYGPTHSYASLRDNADDDDGDDESDDGCPGLTTDDGETTDTASEADYDSSSSAYGDDEWDAADEWDEWLMDDPEAYAQLAGRDLEEDFFSLALT